MEQVAAGGPEDKRTWRRALARVRGRLLRKEEAREAALPQVGEVVDGYVLEAKLGEGGFGTVYRARCGGRRYAVKFLYLPRVGPWAQRELEVLLRLQRVGAVALEGHGRWPKRAPLFLYIVMEYVPGQSLYTWAHRHHPSARRVVEVMRELARQLVVVHALGVVHRDVKGENVLQGEDGRPVLVDFGVSTYAGAPEVTGGRVPGSRLYRGPEAVRFERLRQRGERYQATPGDDVWALGVVLYKLLTDAHPFDGDDDELDEAIERARPEPPQVRNPRVPPVLGALCLRLLEKVPEARLADAKELGAALEELLAGADASWDVPLCEVYGPEEAMPSGEPSTPLPPTVAAPPTPGEPGQSARSSSGPPRAQAAPWRWAVGAGVVLGLALLLFLLSGHFPPHSAPVARAGGPVVVDSFPPLEAPIPLGPEERSAPGEEVAPAHGPPEGGRGAAPPRAATPAPVASATLPEDSTRVKTPPQQTPPQKKSKTVAGRMRKVLSAAATCTALSGCPPGAQVRPPPAVEACPAGALETMERLGISPGDIAEATFEPFEPEPTLREGPITVKTDERFGQLPAHTVLIGQVFFGEERAYGRFTQARPPGGDTLPVCLIAWDPTERQRGFISVGKVGPDTAEVSASVEIKAVQRFE